jgi:mono/diheme cytochrome c family protein
MHLGRIAAVLALGAGVLTATGCGGSGEDADVAAGKQTFVNLCSSCHTLDDSGRPPSAVGPDLDDAFRAARQVDMHEDQFAGVVERWIEIAQPPMPRNLVEGQDKKNVAAYIAQVAGTTPESSARPAQTTPEVPKESRQLQHDDDQ